LSFSFLSLFDPNLCGGAGCRGFMHSYIYAFHTLRVESKCALAGDACLGLGVWASVWCTFLYRRLVSSSLCRNTIMGHVGEWGQVLIF
jgi:hypothetical protein